MAKQTWVKDNGQWRKVKSAWANINGSWKKDVMPKGVMSGNWKEFMSYGFRVLNELALSGSIRNATSELIDYKDGLLLLWNEVYNSNLSRKTTFETGDIASTMLSFPYVDSDYVLYLSQAASRLYFHRVLSVSDGSEISDLLLNSFGQPYTGEFIYSRNGEVVFYNQWDDYGGRLTVMKLDITNKTGLPIVLKEFTHFSRQSNKSIVIGETSGYIYVIYRYSATNECQIRGFKTTKTNHTVREYETKTSDYFNKLNAASNEVICTYDSVRNVFTFFDGSLSITKEINNPFDNINADSRMFIDKDDNYYLFDNASKKMIVCDNNLNIKYEQIVPVNTNYKIERIKYDQSINQAYLIFKEGYYIRRVITISI